MLPSSSTVFACIAALAVTVQASPQGFGGPGGSGGGAGGNGATTSATTTLTRATVASTATASTAAAAASSTSSSTSACNNAVSLCSRTYDNITHLGAHDSSFVRDASTSYSVAGDQYYNATVALDAGVRMLQAQVHTLNGALELCHTSCDLMDAGTLEAWLADIKYWMDNNANEVVTLLLVNSDDQSASTFGSVFSTSGIDKYGYTPTSKTSWPTLQTMIDADTRLVTFIASLTTDSSYSYLLNEWDYVFETAYDITSTSGFNCTLDRPSSESSASAAISAGMMPLMNHFLYQSIIGIEYADTDSINTTNSASTTTTGALGKHAATCQSEWSMAPTFILVNFFNMGPAITTVDNLNGVSATGRLAVAAKEVTTSAAAKDGDLHVSGAMIMFLAAALLLA